MLKWDLYLLPFLMRGNHYFFRYDSSGKWNVRTMVRSLAFVGCVLLLLWKGYQHRVMKSVRYAVTMIIK